MAEKKPVNNGPEMEKPTVENPENEAKSSLNQEIDPDAVNSSENQHEEADLPPAEENALPDSEQLVIDLNLARQELAHAKAEHLKLLAEFDNFRKRNARERADLIQFASADVLKALLPVLDDFQRSLTVMDKTDNLSSIREGISMVNENFYKILAKQGLEPIVSKGQPFSAELHEAIGSFPVQEESHKGIVLEEVEKGYKLRDKVIRYAKVIVGE